MSKSTASLTPAQLEIMNHLWDHGELGVAEVWKLLAAKRRIARNTVQTTLTRLAERGWLRVRSEGNAHYFRAARPRAAAIRSIVGPIVETVFAGSTSGLIATMLENRSLSAEEADRIRQLIDRAERDT